MLAALQQPANFVPLTNAVLSEMARRGISRDKILMALRKMGEEVPAASLELLRWAAEENIELRVISDCNTVFINHMLQGTDQLSLKFVFFLYKAGHFVKFYGCSAVDFFVLGRTCEKTVHLRGTGSSSWHAGAGASTLVREVITNSASFERSMTSDSAKDLTKLEAWGSQHVGQQQPPLEESSHRLFIRPRHDDAVDAPHACPLCPANLCKVRTSPYTFHLQRRENPANPPGAAVRTLFKPCRLSCGSLVSWKSRVLVLTWRLYPGPRVGGYPPYDAAPAHHLLRRRCERPVSCANTHPWRRGPCARRLRS